MTDQLLGGFLRGTGADAAHAPDSSFVNGASVAAAPGLRFAWPNTDGKIFLGVVGGNVEREDYPDRSLKQRFVTGGVKIGIRDDRHIITVAGSRAGKGRAAVLPNLLTYPGSVLVVDPKGDLARLTAVHRSQRLKQSVFVLDPFGVSGVNNVKPVCYNPLEILKPGSLTLVEDAGLIADALVVPSGGDSAHWDDSSRQLIETLVLHVATSPKYEGKRDLLRVAELINNIQAGAEDELSTLR